jgi:hypothetical protein
MAAADARTVDEFMSQLDHPLKPALAAARKIILGADPRIEEGVKWNAVSFRVGEWFATANVRKDEVLIIFHLGAKASKFAKGGMRVADPAEMLEWLAKDRAAVRFRSAEEVKAGKKALAAIVKNWIGHLE